MPVQRHGGCAFCTRGSPVLTRFFVRRRGSFGASGPLPSEKRPAFVRHVTLACPRWGILHGDGVTVLVVIIQLFVVGLIDIERGVIALGHWCWGGEIRHVLEHFDGGLIEGVILGEGVRRD